jgi:hypothetical protein
MPEFTIHEVQNVTELRHFRYTVTANTKEEALEKVMSGECAPPEDLGRIGDTDYGDNGWGHTCEEALSNWEDNSPIDLRNDRDPADDMCEVCGKRVGYGNPAFHLGICDDCATKDDPTDDRDQT